ncbi:MAG: branched-chain-amino-acid transaminase [Planctomycetaceae bacterium]|nr:branched-chain-amino-acid transaminase [Planctomycetaceae bacterium]
MSLKIYIDGKLYDKEDAKISVYDHGLLYGDGVFEGIRCYVGKVFRLDEHLDRLWDSAKAIALEIPMTKADLAKAVVDTLAVNNIKDGYIRLLVTRGVGSLGLDPNKAARPSIIIITDSIALYPADWYQKGLDIVTSSVQRMPPAALSPRVKSMNYLNNILAKIEASNAGCIEAMLLNQKGEVAECTGDNIFFVRKGKLCTPGPDAGILEGITRNSVIELAEKMGIEVCQTPLTKFDAYVADECFLTGSGAELIPVVKIDGRVIGDGTPGPITKKIIERFHKLVRE